MEVNNFDDVTMVRLTFKAQKHFKLASEIYVSISS